MFLVVFGGFWWFLAVHGLKQRHSEMKKRKLEMSRLYYSGFLLNRTQTLW